MLPTKMRNKGPWKPLGSWRREGQVGAEGREGVAGGGMATCVPHARLLNPEDQHLISHAIIIYSAAR